MSHTDLSLPGLVAPLLAVCREAAAAIVEHYDSPGADAFHAKADDSPLTRADLASHAILSRGLQALAPGVPVLSEESRPEDVAGRRDWQRFWLVDPLDGTKEFLARTGEFTINIALIEEHRPVFGLLYVPLRSHAFVGIPGELALQFTGPDCPGLPLATRPLSAQHPLVVLASRRHRGERLTSCLAGLASAGWEIERRNSGSALKFCDLAAGDGDFYPRFAPCSEWDTAAGQALLEAAGGALLDLAGQPLRYNCRDSLLSPPFLAIADPGHALWADVLAEIAASGTAR
ncbi:3'(2'),5'-bisphosphate nucleotidase CysQ [Mangrovimicrobium sediminis]|uniref:3'(2'),5'-bisphosphate nucleotidase CysQ n=1 Tax=Mangrovimicrobium sediminis TaxID=2562682 RepID=A0A4Z0M8G8_9GAMM|nr:3'(2'),5'-bisphosphate nucleotidase CysQ [Haliea sp. SAOS-164]TGD75677.1 3'(2'),5'-bisphosphate nucleotidase CysQ [Haliea sp. SAOS-164]